MKNKPISKIALLLGYCVPFAFFAVNGDAAWGSMAFYAVMVVGFAALCWDALRINAIPIIYIGNAISCLSSHLTARLYGLEPMGYYFKPFTSYSLITAISIAVVLIQTIPVLVHMKKHRK